MGQEFFIKSENLESQVRRLLPSQGGLGAGFDLSASTQIVPIVDLTESAEGSNLRADLQSALSFDTVTNFTVNNATDQVIINNTGYYRVFGSSNLNADTSGADVIFKLTDGATTKEIWHQAMVNSPNASSETLSYDFIVFIDAGDSLTCTSTNAQTFAIGCTRQLATIDGELVNP